MYFQIMPIWKRTVQKACMYIIAKQKPMMMLEWFWKHFMLRNLIISSIKRRNDTGEVLAIFNVYANKNGKNLMLQWCWHGLSTRIQVWCWLTLVLEIEPKSKNDASMNSFKVLENLLSDAGIIPEFSLGGSYVNYFEMLNKLAVLFSFIRAKLA